MTKRTSIILSALLLVAAQLVFAVHELKHDPFSSEAKVCLLCLAGNGLNHAVCGTTAVFHTPSSPPSILPWQSDFYRTPTYCHTPPRGPPSRA